MPLKGKQLVVHPLKTLRKALSITPSYTSCIPQQVKTLMLWQKWEKLDHLEERLMVVEGVRNYAFTDVEELFLVPKHGHSQVQGAGL